MTSLINLNTYRFVRLEKLEELRGQIKALCRDLDLKGTILIAHEGLNIGVSGTPHAIEKFKDFASQVLGIERCAFKEARITTSSFNRLLVKIKKEIIPVGDPEVRPDVMTGKRLSAAELKTWLDEGRPIVLLDTRNRYEVEVGTFVGAEDLGLAQSRDFAEKVAPRIEELKKRTVVTFCTGGIRCEKGSALLMKMGLEDVYQLDGGILRYLEVNGASHYHGNCFVYDWRLAVDGELQPVPRSPDPAARFGRHL